MTPVLTGHRPVQRPPFSDSWRHFVAHLLRAASAAGDVISRLNMMENVWRFDTL